MKIIIIKNEDGTCAIVHPCPAARGVDVRPGVPLVSSKTGKVTKRLPGDVYGADGVRTVLGLGREETEEEFLIRVAKQAAAIRDEDGNVIGEKEWRIADKDLLPSDRTFRNAWTDSNPTDTVDIDMGRARDIHRQRLRRERQPLLAALDVEFTRAMEDDDKTRQSEIVRRKQALRDITRHPEIESAETPEQLKEAAVAVIGR